MNIIVNFDQNTTSLPTGLVLAVDHVVSYFDSLFTIPVTVTINVGFGEINGRSIGANALGESLPVFNGQAGFLAVEGYSSVRNALVEQNAAGSSTLPSSVPPLAPTTLALTQAEGKALGLIANSGSLDGYVGFSSTPGVFSYSSSATPPPNQYYFVGVVEHEFSEIMGRSSFLDVANLYSPMDLFRYSAVNARQFSSDAPSYFSLNNGVTDLDNFNNFRTGNSGDLADWAPSAGSDSYDDNSDPGVINFVTTTDITLMNAIGWTSAQPLSMALSAATNSGVLGGWITENTAPEIIGTGQAGDIVTLYVNGSQVRTTTIDAKNSWSLPIGTLAFGSYSLEVIETSGGHTVATSTSNLFVADTVGNIGDFFGLGTSGDTAFFRFTAGQLDAYEYNSSGQALGAAGFSNAGSPFIIDSLTTVVGGGQDYFGLGAAERAVFLRSGSGQLEVWEFNSANQATGAGGFTNQSSLFTVDPLTTVVGGGEDFFGLGASEHTVFLRTRIGQLQAWEFNSIDQATGATDFINAGSVLAIDARTTVAGAFEDALSPGQRDLFVRDAASQLLFWQFNAAEQMTGYVGLSANGSPFLIDSATSVVGARVDGVNGLQAIGLSNETSGKVTWWDISGSSLINPHT